MKKLLATIIITAAFSLKLLAQDSLLATAPMVQSNTIEFNGSKYQGSVIEFDSPEDLVEASIKESFNAPGSKPKTIKDFMVFRNVFISSIDPSNPVDAFVKVERKSKKEKEKTLVYLIATRPGEIPDGKVKSDGTDGRYITPIASAGGFLTALHPKVEVKKHEKRIADKQEEIKKSEKKLKDLTDDQASLEKKIKQYQKDLEENKKAQEQANADLINQKKVLETLNAKKWF